MQHSKTLVHLAALLPLLALGCRSTNPSRASDTTRIELPPMPLGAVSVSTETSRPNRPWQATDRLDTTADYASLDWTSLADSDSSGLISRLHRSYWQDPEGTPPKQGKSAADIAKELANPTTALGTINTRFNYELFDGNLPGASSQDSTSILLQPSLPYPINKSNSLLIRPGIPLFFDKPRPIAGGFDHEGFQLGDISYDLAVGGTNESGLMLLGGVVGSFPTATHDTIGSNQWTLGPEALVGVVKKWGLLGVLLNHQWDIASTTSGAADVNITGGQYFYAFFLSDGWVISSGPTFSYNHEATSGNRLNLPLGLGINRTLMSGERPWKLSFEVWYHVESPDTFGPEWTFRFTAGPVVALPW